MRLLYLPECLSPKGAFPRITIAFTSSKEESILPPAGLFSYPPHPAASWVFGSPAGSPIGTRRRRQPSLTVCAFISQLHRRCLWWVPRLLAKARCCESHAGDVPDLHRRVSALTFNCFCRCTCLHLQISSTGNRRAVSPWRFSSMCDKNLRFMFLAIF